MVVQVRGGSLGLFPAGAVALLPTSSSKHRQQSKGTCCLTFGWVLCLPGCCLQELLGKEWRTYEQLTREEKAAAFPAVQNAVHAAHSVQLCAAGNGGGDAAGVAAHGDLR